MGQPLFRQTWAPKKSSSIASFFLRLIWSLFGITLLGRNLGVCQSWDEIELVDEVILTGA